VQEQDDPVRELEDDAVEQIRRAVALYREVFGRDPKGFWPAEGAVDERSVALYREHGLAWIATDEAILFRSLGKDDRAALYRPYRFSDVTIGFRDHALSDLIGFTYRYKPAHEAAAHFMRSLEPIAPEKGTVFVILDGENAWEFYEDNALAFFTELYGRLETASWCRTVTMDEVAERKDAVALERLAPGSWIHGNFNTWAGHREKNRAWELIYQTRRDVDHYPGTVSPRAEAAIRRHFLAAECSDWFWWYGDDHATEFAEEFDALFRGHLIAIYRELGMTPPSDLFVPIITHRSGTDFLRPPQSPISPRIDGKETFFFEWLGSGCVDETKVFSTMDRVRGPVERILFGHDDTRAYFAFEGATASLPRETTRLIVIVEETHTKLELPFVSPPEEGDVEMAIGERLELSLSRSLFGGNGRVHLRFEIVEGDTIVQTLPGYGALALDLDETYEENWFV
jgi:hypothetical protein